MCGSREKFIRYGATAPHMQKTWNSKQIIRTFFIPVNGCNLGIKVLVFMIIEILHKKAESRNLGQSDTSISSQIGNFCSIFPRLLCTIWKSFLFLFFSHRKQLCVRFQWYWTPKENSQTKPNKYQRNRRNSSFSN